MSDEDTETATPTTPKTRDILFRGVVYGFKPIGLESDPTKRRTAVVERWQADIHMEDGAGYNVIVSEFRNGSFTPWTYEGVIFNDFVQAAIVGVVSGSALANFHLEEWKHERTRQKLMLFAMPAVAVISLLIGIVIGLRQG